MKFLPFLLLALPAFGFGTGGALAPISLYVHFDHDAAPEVVLAIEGELKAIMAPIGLSFVWRDLASADGSTTSVELAVISFKGSCSLEGISQRNFNPGRLGWTHVSDGVILPFADVNCSAVREFTQRELLAVRPADRIQVYGKAVGRVLAHELYHIFANTRHHGSEGVGREYYTVNDLTTADFQFQARESMALKNSKVYDILAAAGDDTETRLPERGTATVIEKIQL